MGTPITYPTFIQNDNYCSVADVRALIGNVEPILNGTLTDEAITANISAATAYMEARCNKFFSPRRIVRQIDGPGGSRLVLPDSPIININLLSVYWQYPLALVRQAYDWDLLQDRKSGIVAFPTFIDVPFFSPYGFTFHRGSFNVTLDYWAGYTQSVYSDALVDSGDHQTYAFRHPCVVKQAQVSNGNPGIPPVFTPTIYKNSVPITANTSYVRVDTTGPTITQQWQVDADNQVFTFNQSASGGYDSITFNSPNQSIDVITADYTYALPQGPDDVSEATAKRAAITILASIGTALLPDLQYQGATEIQADGSRIRWQAGGPFGEIIADWKSDVEQVISTRKKAIMANIGLGYTDRMLG